MLNFIRSSAKALCYPMFRVGRETAIRLAKIEAAKRYIQVIQAIRRLFLGYIGLSLCLFLMLAGFLLLHVGLLGMLYLQFGIKFVIGICVALGAFYLFVTGASIACICYEKNWLKCGHCDELLAPLLRKE